jgi:RHS repeat-associated protein
VDGGLTLSWTYDRYGNRWTQSANGTGNASAVQPNLAFYGNNNQVSGWDYDAAGNLTNDNRNTYAYDAEGRIASLNSAPTYAYDAEGRRVAKLGSGGTVATSYILDLGGNQVTELNASGGWKHSNVWAAGGRLLATYEGPAGTDTVGYHFHLTDWLGTQRMQTTAAGNQEEECYSYPFGDGLTCTGTDATEHHFTSKERDTESGLDYFGARYLSSDLGRFMTPDWAAKPTAVPYASFGNPQSLNLYSYVGNNPNTGIDLDGHVGTDPPDCASLPQNPLASVTPDEKSAMEDSVTASDSENGDDNAGEFHEEGGTSFTTDGKKTIAPAAPGEKADPSKDKNAHMDLNKAADPAKQKPDGIKADVQWHVHPGGTKTTLGISSDGHAAPKINFFTQSPSGPDLKSASAKLNVVIGAGNSITPSTVFVYNSSGTVCTESWRDFTK